MGGPVCREYGVSEREAGQDKAEKKDENSVRGTCFLAEVIIE